MSAPPDAPEPRRARLDAKGNERPEFLLDFPEDPALEPLIAAFEAGNYARVRELAPRVAEAAENAEVRSAALELRRRIDPDPLARYLLLVSVLLFVFLAVWAYAVQGH
jgi:hypothetical protein